MTKTCSKCGAENDLRNLVCRVCRSQLPASSHTERTGNMRNIITGAVTIAVLGVSLTACHSSGSASAAASAAATSTSAAYVKEQSKAILDKCVPVNNALTELEWARNMAAGKHSKNAAAGTQARQTFETCAGVSKQNDAKFQNQAATQGKQVLETYAHDVAAGNKAAAKAAVKNFVEDTIPQDAVADR